MEDILKSMTVAKLTALAKHYTMRGYTTWGNKENRIIETIVWFRAHSFEMNDFLSRYGLASAIPPLVHSPPVPSPRLTPTSPTSPQTPRQITSIPMISIPSQLTTLEPDLEAYNAYVKAQKNLSSNRVPRANTTFQDLLNPIRHFAFLDVTPYIKETVDQTEDPTQYSGKNILIRPRRSGKSIFGNLWLEFFRGNQEFLRSTKIVNMIPVPNHGTYVGVHLDFSAAITSSIIEYIIQQYNKGLRLTGVTEQLSNSPPASDVLTINNRFSLILERVGKKAAIFVDEYDHFIRKAEGNYDLFVEAQTITQNFFTSLKSLSTIIPLVYITGSSRVAISGIWSGGNDIADLSYHSEWSTALGYTWNDIERLYDVQLTMLQQLYSLSREQLKFRLETLYDSYLFGPKTRVKVFSIWPINRFIESGIFSYHLSISGLSGILVNGAFSASTLRVLANSDYTITTSLNDMESWRFPDPKMSTTDFSTYMHLHAAGILTFLPSITDTVKLKIPNEDALYALIKVLPNYARGFNIESFNNFMRRGRIIDAIEILQPALRDMALDTGQAPDQRPTILEYHIQHAFFGLMELARVHLGTKATWRRTSETPFRENRHVDFIIHVLDNMNIETPYILEFGRSKNKNHESIKTDLLHEFRQAIDYAREYAEIYAGMSTNKPMNAPMVVAALWDVRSELLSAVGPYTLNEAEDRYSDIESTPWAMLQTNVRNVRVYEQPF